MADERVRNVEELLSDFPEGPHGERWLRLIRAAIEREKAQAVAGAALAIAQTVRELAFSPTEWNPEGTPQSIEAACLLRAAADADKEGGDE